MAFLETYTDEENPGVWYTLARDPDRNVPVQFRIRAESRELREALDKEFGRDQKARGIKYRSIPDKLQQKADVAQAARLWTDAKNLWIRVRTQGAIELYSEEMQLNGNGPALGDEVCLDGKLTDKIKQDILDQNMALTLAILAKGRLLEEQEAADREDLEKN